MDSYLYCELTREELFRIVSAHFEGDFSSRLLSGGMFNTTYLITMASGERYVLRMGPVNRHLLLPYEHTLMQGEELFYREVSAAGVPTSEVVACDVSKALLDRDYMIVRYIPSLPLTDKSLPAQARPDIFRQTGRCMACVHAITGKRFGRAAQIAMGQGCDTWGEWLVQAAEQWNQACAGASLLDDDERARMVQLFRRYRPLFDEITVPHLVHADLWAGNVLVRQEGEAWHVAAIIDGDRAVFGDVEFEFASGWMINDDFLAGYGPRPEADENTLLRRKLYQLMFQMDNYYIFAMEYDAPEDVERYLSTARRLAEELEHYA